MRVFENSGESRQGHTANPCENPFRNLAIRPGNRLFQLELSAYGKVENLRLVVGFLQVGMA